MNKLLTHKQQLFVSHYLANSGNGVQAARDSGYKGTDETLRSVAKENLTKPHIRAEIEMARNSLKSQSVATAQAKREKLWEVAQHNSEIIRIQRGGQFIEAMRNPSATISAITELNKMDGDYAPQKINNQGEIIVYLDEDDLALAGK